MDMYMYLCISVCFLLIGKDALSAPVKGPVENMEVKINEKTGGFQLCLSDKLWFNSADLWVHNNGRWLTTHDKSLVLVDKSSFSGRLDWGPMEVTNFKWKSSDGSFHFSTYTVVFQEVPAVIFGQQWDDGGTHTNTTSRDVISLWPTFKIEDMKDVERGYMTYSGNFAVAVQIDKISSSNPIYSNIDGGLPLIIYDSDMKNTIVISPQNTFMSATQTSFLPDGYDSPIFGLGIVSAVDTVPRGYAMETLVVAGENVTGTMEKWGKLLRIRYKKEDHYRLDDFTINYLGYYTDNGACYYYYTGEYDNYEEALVAVKENGLKSGIPYRYVQLDSWWYYKGAVGGIKNWTAMPSVFPHGIWYLSNKTDWPIVAHNRYWSNNTDYAKQNGGLFNFIIDEDGYALPVDPEFWRYLLSTAKDEWNLKVYEQDWLDNEYSHLNELTADLNLGQMWLLQMGEAAEELGLTIQYCMPWPRHILQSVMIPTVTQIRASDDYRPGNSNWRLGDTTIMAHALGLAAFKDDFHTLSNEPNCKFPSPEPYPALETYVAALSGGPVGPSDTATSFNKTLIMATCMADGRLLKPSRPAMSLDSTVLYRAFGKGGPNGDVVASYSEISGLTWYYILAADLQDKYDMSLTELPPSHSVKPKTSFPASIAFRYNLRGAVSDTVFDITKISSNKDKISIKECGRDDFQYWSIAPVLPIVNAALLGELDKVVNIAEQRILTVILYGDAYVVKLRGAPGERVTMWSYGIKKNSIQTITCTIAADGTSSLAITNDGVLDC